MATTARGRAPAHLWIVGLIALLWNAYGCYEYLMTNMRDEAYLAKFPADALAYYDSLPGWLTALWAIGVWGGLAGSILLLMRSRYSVWAFALSLIGALVDMVYQMFMTSRPPSMTSGVVAIIPWVIILFAAFLAWYSWNEEKKGELR